MAKTKILVVDDENHILELIQFNLEHHGFEVVTVDNGEAAVEYIEKESTDLMILDLMLPKISGLEVCKKVRKLGKDFPIIMLTAKGEEIDKITGLEIGADDYMTKPFSIGELIARIKAILRRVDDKGRESEDILTVGDIIINTEKHEVIRNGKAIELTLKEFELLKMLALNRGKVLSRDVLLDKIWGYEYYGDTRTVDVHIRHLRKKIEDDDINLIETVRGVGYKMR